MPVRKTPLINDHYYHVFNRGVEKRLTFTNNSDYQRFLEMLYYYQFSGPKPKFSIFKRFKNNSFSQNSKIVEVICYCLMPNHFHLLIKQLQDEGIQEFLGKIANSYTKYFNTKNKRVGHLFQGEFKSVLVESEEQLVHLSRYIHLNPYVAGITAEWWNYPFSSIVEYTENVSNLCNVEVVKSAFRDKQEYFNFIKDYEAYALELSTIKHLVLDEH